MHQTYLFRCSSWLRFNQLHEHINAEYQKPATIWSEDERAVTKHSCTLVLGRLTSSRTAVRQHGSPQGQRVPRIFRVGGANCSQCLSQSKLVHNFQTLPTIFYLQHRLSPPSMCLLQGGSKGAFNRFSYNGYRKNAKHELLTTCLSIRHIDIPNRRRGKWYVNQRQWVFKKIALYIWRK